MNQTMWCAVIQQFYTTNLLIVETTVHLCKNQKQNITSRERIKNIWSTIETPLSIQAPCLDH